MRPRTGGQGAAGSNPVIPTGNSRSSLKERGRVKAPLTSDLGCLRPRRTRQVRRGGQGSGGARPRSGWRALRLAPGSTNNVGGQDSSGAGPQRSKRVCGALVRAGVPARGRPGWAAGHQRSFRTKSEAASLLLCSNGCSNGTHSHQTIATESRWTAKRAPWLETWPCTSPVTATKECPSSSGPVCSGTPAASMSVAKSALARAGRPNERGTPPAARGGPWLAPPSGPTATTKKLTAKNGRTAHKGQRVRSVTVPRSRLLPNRSSGILARPGWTFRCPESAGHRSRALSVQFS